MRKTRPSFCDTYSYRQSRETTRKINIVCSIPLATLIALRSSANIQTIRIIFLTAKAKAVDHKKDLWNARDRIKNHSYETSCLPRL